MPYPNDNGLRRLPRPFVISSQAALAASHSRAMRTHARVMLGFFGFLTASPCPSRARLAHINGSCRIAGDADDLLQARGAAGTRDLPEALFRQGTYKQVSDASRKSQASEISKPTPKQ